MSRIITHPAASGLIQGNAKQGQQMRVCGWSIGETGGTTDLVMNIRTSITSGPRAIDPDGSALIVFREFVPKGTCKNVWFGDHGVEIDGGMYIEIVSGTAAGSVFVQ